MSRKFATLWPRSGISRRTSAAPIPSSKPREIPLPGNKRWPSGTRVEIEPAAIHYAEIKLISPFHHTPRFIREALEAIRRGDILAHDFVTEEIRLEDLPQAFQKMKSRSGEIKLAVRP
jgi:threonine dehydrogenase-like Zn-dependent dehydrogenase